MGTNIIMLNPEELKAIIIDAIKPLISSQKNVENEDLLITR